MLLEEKLSNLPTSPGVYIMKDENGNVIYVGKAVNLRNRVRQYFQNSQDMPSKTRLMVRKIKDLDYIVTDNEVEALILECNLIKEYRPKYNVLLRDDKNYQYIKITNEMFPRLVTTRKVEKDGSRYFGPYVSGYSVKQTVELLKSLFMLRTCKKKFPDQLGKGRPCLNFHIEKCLGVCKGDVSEEEYQKLVERAVKVLSGKGDEIVEELKAKMFEYAENLMFEKAQEIKNKLSSLEQIITKQKVIYADDRSEDVINFAKDQTHIAIVVLIIRNGKLINKEEFVLKAEEDTFERFLEQYYADVLSLPKEIIIPHEIENFDNIEKMIEKLYGFKVKVIIPKQGEKKQLLDMAKKNAEISLANRQRVDDVYAEALLTLKSILGLENEIEKIESYDISNIAGADNVGTLVVFEDGRFNKEFYRKFKIKGFEGQDDIRSVKEVLTRRFTNLEKHGRIPDLILIDGGQNQVNAALEVLNTLGFFIPVAGMVKDDRHKTRDLIYNGKEAGIQEYPLVYKLIYAIQEETHRFAVKFHREVRKKHLYESILDEIEGIGEKRKLKLFRTFGSIDNLRKASIEEIVKAADIPYEVALKIKEKIGV
ncbi:excinuclease ABC subunit C [Caldicellulosiruptor bescii]|uniref:UvrABC system protein C n=2 Tax=Caldicellulosiruptor bescii TaxID=31899 RepID=B9MN43_CALBD|nr:excinuclease ABC subunit UvrC [Caldicellulosiruptor bescii]ACM59499.1 excinuclease ABC, C subunit [Caldicellulosiruptor bescii DSM 6725]PBC89531.1 excinuclease ABC subunit C [Caldicellulosiruptor bescii]PBC89853.1 excinuclease ABC subunit C [Caldicellulosiruptor bescii]PBD04720.1 excinuclease ABC subunit C [Caldicellulosiruptor bescii]PBD05649.1 excinuclease ABC subunit C [Caldicellulosiruptor bescii]